VRYGDKWAAIMELPADPLTGKRRRRWIYAATQREVTQKMNDAKASDARRRGGPAEGERVETYFERWLAETIRPNMRPATVASYESVVSRHLVPVLGKLRLCDISGATVQAFYASLREQGVGVRTVQKAHAVLHRALASATRAELIDSNPAALEADVPRYRAGEREPLTRAQAKKLLQTARGDRLEALYVLALTTGARQGELFALRWSDVDFAKSMLSIRRSLQDADGRGALVSGATKTRSSRRRFEISELALRALTKHRELLVSEDLPAGDRDLIFPARNGLPIRRQNFLRRDFYPLLERASLPKIHFHDLRHTAATQLAAAGAPVVQVAQLLGHADPTITLRTYQHAFEGAAGDAARRLGDLFETGKDP